MTDSELRAALERHHGESYGWALSCCAHSSVDAEAVLQTVYLKALSGKARYDGRASFRTWLFAVIRRTAADERRRQTMRCLLMARPQAILTTSAVEQPDETYDRAELQRQLRDALAQLPRRQREILQLVFYHDLSLAESAQVMGVSLGAARTHYDRGKKQLRERMKGWKLNDEARTGRDENQRIVSATKTGR
jgi:RNA polymerase sigma-70 factor, ECF subfamily